MGKADCGATQTHTEPTATTHTITMAPFEIYLDNFLDKNIPGERDSPWRRNSQLRRHSCRMLLGNSIQHKNVIKRK